LEGDLPINSIFSFNLLSLKPRPPKPELVALVAPLPVPDDGASLPRFSPPLLLIAASLAAFSAAAFLAAAACLAASACLARPPQFFVGILF
jgi:hypothetical protein